MALFKVCSEDPVLRDLRKLYGATPLRIPETRVRPVGVVAIRKNKADFRGKLEHLLHNGQDFEVPVYQSDMPGMAAQNTRSMGIDLGLKLLGGFLEGFGITPATVAPAFDQVKLISFSFKGVKRFYIDKNEFGALIKDKKLDLETAAISIYNRKVDPYKFIVINSVFTANELSVHLDKTTKADLNLEIPLSQVVSNLDFETAVKVANQKTISIEGTQDLTFAFTGFELGIDWTQGRVISLMNTKQNLPVPLGEVDQSENLEVVLTKESELLGWDSIS